MGVSRPWIIPFVKQCFVTAGVSLNMSASGLVVGFAAGLLEQLKAPGSTIPIDDSLGSWLAAIPAFFLFVGNFLVIPIMGKYGRRTANLISITMLIVAWIGIIFANSITVLLTARALQGIVMGMATTLGPLLIGEYTSPKNRGAFLMTISISISIAVLSVHALGSTMRWQTGAIACTSVALLNLVIVIFSPESPSWLASQGRYEDCKTVFRWLRGSEEEEELSRMIEANTIARESKAEANISESVINEFKKYVVYANSTIRKREFYRPMIIMIHIYSLSLWGGVNLIVVYASDLLHAIVGTDINLPLIVMTLDAQRIISNMFAIYIVKKIKRRTMLFTTVGMNIAALLATAVYSYAKVNQALPFDHPMIGIILTHCMMFPIAVGTLSLSFIIAGEIFPLEYKNLAGGISVLTYSASLFIILKTIPFCFTAFGVHGTYCLNALIVSYCMLIAWILLPETKDRTLQDIEDEFRGKPMSIEELKSAQSLTAWQAHSSDRRCSAPIIT